MNEFLVGEILNGLVRGERVFVFLCILECVMESSQWDFLLFVLGLVVMQCTWAGIITEMLLRWCSS